MSPRRTSSLLLIASLLTIPLLGVTACAGVQMAVQEPVAQVAPQPITKDGKVLTYGSWTAERTKGGLIRTVSVGAGPWGAEAVQQDFDYTVSGGPASWTGTCAYDASGQNVAFSKFGEASAFLCTITPSGGAALTLVLSRNGSGRGATLDGKLEGGGNIEVKMTRTTADGNTPIYPVGYHFLLDGTPVAAVQVANPNQIWIAADLDPAIADGVGAAAAALVYSYPAIQQTFSSL